MSKLLAGLTLELLQYKTRRGRVLDLHGSPIEFPTVTNHVASHADVAWEATNHINFWSHFTNHAIR